MTASRDRPAWSADAVAAAVESACLLEVGARKPGNITPLHDFADTTYEDMRRSAVAIAPVMTQALTRGVGGTVLAAVRATRSVAASNTNLGIVLLLAPLARAALLGPPAGGDLRAGLRRVLAQLNTADAREAYAAIRLAQAGGLGHEDGQDVQDEPTVTLLEAMVAAQARDRIAAEYASDFAVTFETALPALRRALARRARPARGDRAPAPGAARGAARHADRAQARLAASRRPCPRTPRATLAAGEPGTPEGERAIAGFDARLRRPDNALNPGTTADLVAGTLFVALLEGAAVSRGPILVVSVSARMLAELATGAGHEVTAACGFGDLDLRRLCPVRTPAPGAGEPGALAPLAAGRVRGRRGGRRLRRGLREPSRSRRGDGSGPRAAGQRAGHAAGRPRSGAARRLPARGGPEPAADDRRRRRRPARARRRPLAAQAAARRRRPRRARLARRAPARRRAAATPRSRPRLLDRRGRRRPRARRCWE